MATRKINGKLIELMLINGLNNIRIYEKEINNLNVFPVPDGDTGTNMRLTLENGVKFAKRDKDICDYLEGLSKGMLFGARGNSGVILSQFFKGLFNALRKFDEAHSLVFIEALEIAYKTAYDSVTKPVEGTMLTVFRECVEKSRPFITKQTTIEELFELLLKNAIISLDNTPNLLKTLKDAGVVDSGAKGFVVILEGMKKYLDGELLSGANIDEIKVKEIRQNCFNENSKLVYGYCLEFILQLLNCKQHILNFNYSEFKQKIISLGESVVCIQDGTTIKVHIHTFTPATVIDYAQSFGEFVSFKLENMDIQAEEKDVIEKKDIAVISVVNGNGQYKFFSEMGVDYLIDGGNTMSVSAKEFEEAFKKVNAEKIIVYPNNKNIIMAAEQAVSLSGRQNVIILPTKSISENYFSLAFDDPSSTSIDGRIKLLQDGLKGVETLSVTKAQRNYSANGVKCVEGDYIAFNNSELLYSSTNLIDVIVEGLKLIDEIDDKENVVIFTGKNFESIQKEILLSRLEDEFFGMEFTFIDGGQELYDLIMGIV